MKTATVSVELEGEPPGNKKGRTDKEIVFFCEGLQPSNLVRDPCLLGDPSIFALLTPEGFIDTSRRPRRNFGKYVSKYWDWHSIWFSVCNHS